MNRGIFITGTDTGVGKTYVTRMILAELRRQGIPAAGFKPISCGADGRRDAEQFADLMNGEMPLEIVNPVYLKRPLAPRVAARLENRRIDLRKIRSCYARLARRYPLVLIEGAGGLMVPIKRNYFVADLARDLGCPLLVVGRLGLGTINHSVLTVRQARDSGLRVLGLVLNDTRGGRPGLAEKTNIEIVPRLCGVRLLGVVPHARTPRPAVARGICRALVLK